ncbi:yfjP [Symbiodinium natans]|uniref:YfjP protein n=1 Tax=Symbiodinium natans TaxID=878477 RepID=A0A812HQE1_9DINO|nr:yfjP [Symbiodinium natans]
MRALLADVELEPQFQQLQLQLHLPSMKISSKEIVGTARHLALSDVLQSTDWMAGDELADIRNALRLLTRGFTDAMVKRGGLPIYQLPLPKADLEETLPSEYHVAAVDCSVLPHLPLHLQASLGKPPLCESTNLKDLHLRNLRFFIEQTQFNIRHQKDLKTRGGYIAAGDMERIINYMDEEHFAAGRDLAEARALPDDSALRPSNAEGFRCAEECHLQSDRCRALRATLEAVQRGTYLWCNCLAKRSETSVLNVLLRLRDAEYQRAVEGNSALKVTVLSTMAAPAWRLVSSGDAFLSLFGASREVKVSVDGKDGQTLRVTCARVDRPDRPLLIQRAHKGDRDRDEAFQEVDETPLRKAAICAYCKSLAESNCWHRLMLDLSFEDASCQRTHTDWERALLLQALYLDERLDQVALLLELRGHLAYLRGLQDYHRQRPRVAGGSYGQQNADLHLARGEQRLLSVWDADGSGKLSLQSLQIFARLVLEEDFESYPCAYTAPTHNDLAFRITRSSDITGSLHQHLLAVVKTLAFHGASGLSVDTRPKPLQAKVTTKLFPYQKEAAERLLQSRHNGSTGSLDASSLGAGKTLVAVSSLAATCNIPACSLSEFCSVLAMRLGFCMHLASAHGGGQFLVLVASSSLMEGWRDQLSQHTAGFSEAFQTGHWQGFTWQGFTWQGFTWQGCLRGLQAVSGKDDTDAEVLFVISTYSRDECLALQNTDTLQCTAAWRLVSRSLYGGHFISGTMFRRHYSDLLDMLKMLRSSIPLRAEYVQAYFGAYLISYMRPQRTWQTKLVPLDIPAAVHSSYLEVVDECRGRGAQNFVKVLGRMRRVLSIALQSDARPLAEAIWRTAQQLRAEGRRPLVFASTEREADALVRHLGCARRYRRRHPAHCRGCDICRNFNKFAQPGCEKLPPVAGSETGEELLIFTVGSDSAGLNLQSLGDALILRPVQMDQLVQMMGRLDRPGQTSERLCRAILYMKRTHEEAEVAHLQKHAAFWSLHIKPIARLIVMATAGPDADSPQDVSERYQKLLEAEKEKPQAAASLDAGAPEHEASQPDPEVGMTPADFRKRSWSTLRPSDAASAQSPKRSSPNKLAFRQVRGVLPDLAPQLSTTIDLEPPLDLGQQLPRAMTRQSVQLGVGYLIRNDERFRHVVQLIGPPTGILELLGRDRPDPFTTLVQTVCHQQLSVRVCQGMFERLLGLCGNRDTKVLEPERVAGESCDRIREVAKLSYRKIEYIQKIAQHFLDGTLGVEVFEEASDEEIRQRLTQLPGIGDWTLEMFLIFQLHRHGGIPYGDVAIQSAMKMIYNIVPPAHITAKNEVSWMPTRPQMEIFAKRWGPFGSIASLYLLRVADNVNAVFLPD